jgi:hypothetical protein
MRGIKTLREDVPVHLQNIQSFTAPFSNHWTNEDFMKNFSPNFQCLLGAAIIGVITYHENFRAPAQRFRGDREMHCQMVKVRVAPIDIEIGLSFSQRADKLPLEESDMYCRRDIRSVTAMIGGAIQRLSKLSERPLMLANDMSHVGPCRGPPYTV